MTDKVTVSLDYGNDVEREYHYAKPESAKCENYGYENPDVQLGLHRVLTALEGLDIHAVQHIFIIAGNLASETYADSLMERMATEPNFLAKNAQEVFDSPREAAAAVAGFMKDKAMEAAAEGGLSDLETKNKILSGLSQLLRDVVNAGDKDTLLARVDTDDDLNEEQKDMFRRVIGGADVQIAETPEDAFMERLMQRVRGSAPHAQIDPDDELKQLLRHHKVGERDGMSVAEIDPDTPEGARIMELLKERGITPRNLH